MIGIGIGIILSCILLTGNKINYEMSKGRIEIKARGYGMRYPDEMPIINNKEVGK
ncbi:hypothetical protein [Clostridium sp.]|uniref:hypothetical protein n=1 Tax=Clostridium sp. TaxID=1506 RepID=UPI003D6D33BC